MAQPRMSTSSNSDLFGKAFGRDIVAVGLILILFVLISGGFLGFSSARELASYRQQVVESYEVIGKLQTLLSDLKDAETGQRGYLMTQDKAYLAPYEDALKELGKHTQELKVLFEGDPTQQARLQALERLINRKLTELKETIEMVSRGNQRDALEVVKSNVGKELMDSIRAQCAAIESAQQEVLRQRALVATASYQRTLLSIIMPSIIGVVLVGLTLALFKKTAAQRRLAAQALFEQKERYRTTLASIGDAVITTDTQGRVNHLNAVAIQLTGWTNEEAMGLPLVDVFNIVNETSRKTVENPVTRALREGTIVGLANHTILIAKDATEHHIDDSASPIRSEGGEVVGCVLIFRDIGEQRRAENELRETAQHLRRLSAELSEADRRKDEFIAMLAHELRNPLAPIRNGLQVIKMAHQDPQVVASTRVMMERQLGHMIRLVDDLLDVSRISRGKLQLRKERVDLAVVLHNALETSRPIIEAGGHKLVLDLPKSPVYVDADVTRLGQVFANLLNNAAKYSDKGGQIEVSARVENNQVLVKVKDNGVGIPNDMLPVIFDMFTQVDRTLERSQGGLGIGLSLVKRLTEMHGGTVQATSPGLGLGSEFTVSLPVVASVPEATAAHAQTGAAAELPVERRILIADDNTDSAESLVLMLKFMGNNVESASNGLEAVEKAQILKPSVILLDIGMPELNGYEACKLIRQQDWARDVTLIALTGWGQDEDKRRSEEAGFNFHLVKPVDPVVLEKLISELPGEGKK